MADRPQYVTIGLERELLAIPVERVREILEARPVAKLPHTPAQMLGMIDVRGQGVPVIDLHLKLGMASTEDTASTRIVVSRVTIDGVELILGLRADRVFEVTILDEDGLAPPPEIGVRWESACIAGIGRRNGAFATVLDLDRLFSGDELASGGLRAADADAA